MSEIQKEDLFSKLMAKAPGIAFLYHLYDKDTQDSFIDSHRRVSEARLSCIDTFFVFGFSSALYLNLKAWLKQERNRLIFVFHDPAEVEALLASEPLEEIIAGSNIFLCTIAGIREQDIDNLLSSFPSAKLDMGITKGFMGLTPKKRASLRWQMMRRSLFKSALITEKLHYPLLASNLLANMKLVKNATDVSAMAGSLAGVTALLCGAGPSLDDDMEKIRALKGQVLIIACGSAITALSVAGIEPDICIAIDPNKEEYDRLKAAAPLQAPFFFSARLNSACMDLGVWPLGYIPTYTGGALEYFMQQKWGAAKAIVGLDLTDDALSVTTLATSLAIFLGCERVIFSGVDLCYPHGQRYSMQLGSVAKQSLSGCDRSLLKRSRQGERIQTQVRWVMEAKALAAIAKAYREVPFFCTSLKGLAIPFVSYQAFDELMASLKPAPFDISGRIHSLLQGCSIIDGGKILSFLDEIKQSLKRCHSLASSMAEKLKDNEKKGLYTSCPMSCPLVTVMKMDMEEELAFNMIFAPVESAYFHLAKEEEGKAAILWDRVAKHANHLFALI